MWARVEGGPHLRGFTLPNINGSSIIAISNIFIVFFFITILSSVADVYSCSSGMAVTLLLA